MDSTSSMVDNKHETVYKPLTYDVSATHLLKDNRKRQKDSLYLYSSSLIADLLMFDCGCNFTWTSPATSALRSPNLDVNPLGVPVTAVQESWIAAIVNLGAAIGPLVFGKFADVLGRKKVLIAIILLKIASYIMLAFARDIYLFYLARFFLGIGMGLSFAIMPMYTAEISDNHNRGKFVSIMGIFITLGMLYTLIVGPLLPLKTFTLSCTIFLVFVLIGFLTFIPETPIYLISKKKISSAKKLLMRLRNLDSESAEKDLKQLIANAEEANSDKGQFADIFKTPSLRKGLIICLSLCSLQHLSGIFPIMAFIGPIFEVTGSQIPANVSVILVSIVQLISAIFSSFAIEKLGRKPLLLLSTSGTSLTLFSLGLYFYLKDGGFEYIQNIYWLPVTSLMVYMVSLNIGLCSVPMAILSEVFPSNVRSTASSLVTFFGAFTGFSVTFIFPIVMAFLGGAECFWLFSGFTVLGIVFIYFVVPETKGKSISEIQAILRKSAK